MEARGRAGRKEGAECEIGGGESPICEISFQIKGTHLQILNTISLLHQ